MKLNQLFHQLKLNVKFTILIIVMLVIPIGVFAGILFYLMEQNVVDENCNYMQYTMERSQDDIATKIDSINMPTQFFLSDDDLKEALLAAASGQELSTEEWLSLKKNDISSLERLVNNNPLLYSVRVYAINDDVQEMMPILYNHTRMERLAWADDTESGWKFNYVDAVFDSYTMNQNQKLISLVTPIVDYDYGVIGTIEAAMTMQDMFPGLYENIENEWSCFVTDEGELYFGDNEQDDSVELLQEILKQNQKTEETQVVYSKIKGRKLVISSMPVKELSGTLISVKDITENVHRVYFIRNVFVVVMLFVIALLVLWVNHIVKRLLRQLYDILASIREVQKGNLDVVIENCGPDEMGELGTQINKMLRRIKRLMEDNLKREMLMKNSEIRALQNQINAHFIYNVLESIKMMAEIDEEYAISDAVTSLGKLLRYSMKWVSGNVLVEQELEYIKNYMALINLRFDYEIYLSLNIPDSILKQEIPKMSLQPIVENAIYHGIEQMAEDTNIYIKGFVEENDCVIEITDAGKGMTEEEVEQLKKKITGEMESDGGSGNGIGLKNVQDRIQIAFGEKYGIEVASKLGCYTKIRVRIPWHPVYEETVKVGGAV
ncbi:sensor histidine kinase [Roseburia sp. 831b]|uniref:sensor histidine kinase n=1 Tax=Roseburia sp. 831b TaxID=1261635 RepID=UPI0009513EC1|nr:histidine kinase [Roseburia sp. 831b]WVK73626.1 histidine kinase [Roseburia sp. 831b]